MTEFWMKGKPVKAISIMQPWAQLIVEGVKDVENRSRHYKYRGPVLIHTGKTFDYEGYAWIMDNVMTIDDIDSYKTGGFVGKVIIIACVNKWDSKWFSGPYGLLMRDASPIPFYTYKGSLSVPFDAEYPYCACMDGPYPGSVTYCVACGKDILGDDHI